MPWLVSLVTYDSDSEVSPPMSLRVRSILLVTSCGPPVIFLFITVIMKTSCVITGAIKKADVFSTPAYFYFASIAIYLSSFQTFCFYDSIRSRLSLLGNYMSAKRCRILIFPEVLHSFICFPPQCI